MSEMLVGIDVAAPNSKPGEREREEGRTFVAVEGGKAQYDGAVLLVTAYAAIWVVLMGYILMLWRKQASLGARVAGLEAAIDRAVASGERAESKAKAGAEAKTEVP